MKVVGFLSVALACLSISQAFAAPCKTTLGPEDYLVFARGNIEAKQADFQGVTGAGGTISTQNFQFTIHYALTEQVTVCTNVVAGVDITLDQTGVEGGNIEAGHNIDVSDSHVHGKSIAGQYANVSSDNEGVIEHVTTSNVSNLLDASQFFISQSEKLSNQTGRDPQHIGTALLLKASGTANLQTFSMTTDELGKASSLNFYGSAENTFVVNITGSDANIQDKPIRISPSMNPGQIILNFPNATSLKISNTRDPRGVLSLFGLTNDDFGGIPATILAPYADLNFTYGQIDGGVYVKSLSEQGITGPNSGGHGQINRYPTPWTDASN